MKSAILNHTVRDRFHLFILAICVMLVTASAASAQGIKYVYDELGRLIAATDPGGDTARYNYDAAGNVSSISRYSSATLSIISFSPTSGPVGTTVKIYGTAFNTTPSSNTVTFNGTTATVTSATATELVTTVPSGATTGAINVTNSAGSVSSSTSFTVAASTAPTISGLSPTIGASGTSVTISGTNFETTAAKNKTKFNITNSTVSSATSTSISTTVPSVSNSGKVSVATPNGTAVSTDDFFVPPSPYTASDVTVTGRMTPGNSQTVTLSTSGKVGLIVFDAVAGQRASLKVTSCSITSVRLTIYDPSGQFSAAATAITSGGYFDTPTFTSSGTFTILVDPDLTYTGAVTFTLYTFNDIVGSITAGGSSVTVTTSTPGQMDLRTFSGTAGQRVSVKMTSGSFTGGIASAAITLKKLDGTVVSNVTVSTTGFIDTQTLPSTGTYLIVTDPTTSSTGSVTITLYNVAADVTGSITPNGSSVTVTNTSPGQNGLHTFSGTASQRISLKLSSGSYTGGSPSSAHVYIKKPDGTDLMSSVLVASSGFVDVQTLPSSGTYTVRTDPDNASTGSLTLSLYDVTADVTGTITAGGSAVNVTTTSPGQNALHTFSGTTGQIVTLQITSGSFTGGTNGSHVRIKKPDGSELVDSLVVTTGFIDQRTLPTSGTYTVMTDPLDSSIGSLTLNLYSITDSSGSVTIGGSAVTVSTTAPGQNGTLTFSGTASQQVTVRITNNTTSCVSIALKQPNGSQLTSTFSCSGSFNLTQQTLPATGTYTITIDPLSTFTGNLDISVTNP